MRKSKKARGASQVFLIPDSEALEKRRGRLPQFPPHNVLALLHGGRSKGLDEDECYVDAIMRMRKLNLEQMVQLASALGIDKVDDTFWQRAFFSLAHLHHGIGRLTVSMKKPNRNASNWTDAHELSLIREVVTLTSRGLSERKAIETLAADRKKHKLFPYRPQRDARLGLKQRDEYDQRLLSRDMRAMALLRHWQQIKAQGAWSNIIKMLQGYTPRGEVLEQKYPAPQSPASQ